MARGRRQYHYLAAGSQPRAKERCIRYDATGPGFSRISAPICARYALTNMATVDHPHHLQARYFHQLWRMCGNIGDRKVVEANGIAWKKLQRDSPVGNPLFIEFCSVVNPNIIPMR